MLFLFVYFNFECLEINFRFVVILCLVNVVILVELWIDMEDWGGFVEIMMFYVMLELICDLLF